MGPLIKRLRQLDSMTLRTLAGNTIVRAVEDIAPADTEKELAEILLLKYGKEIFNQKEIRLALIDVLSQSEAVDFCRRLGLGRVDATSGYSKLRKYFETYGESKSKKLVDFYGLDSSFYYSPPSDDRKSKILITIQHGEQVTVKSYLHAYQKRMKDDLLERMLYPGDKFLLQMPTGAGKTYTALEAVVDLLRKPRMNKFVVWLVNTNELAEQALQAFIYLWRMKGDKELFAFRLFKNFHADFRMEQGGIVFASFAKMYSVISNRQHEDYESVWHLINNCELLIVDEAHTSVAETYAECIRCFINTDVTSVLGLTATPGRTTPESTQELVALYKANMIGMKDADGKELDNPIGYLQAEGYLAELKTELLETGITIEQSQEEQILANLAANSSRNRKILEQIELAHQAEESTLVFACTLDHVFALTVLCRSKGIPSEFIIGQVEQGRRLDILQRFKEQQFYILINLDILSAGVDVPNVNKILITRPIGSPILYSQVLGRALRGPKNGGNSKNTVINLQDNLLNYPSANLLYRRFREDWNTTFIRR
jgi:DNA repair protein RadD